MSPRTRRREVAVVIAMTVLVAAGVLLFLTLTGGWMFFGLLIVTAALALLGGLHYLAWGRDEMQRAPLPPAQITEPPDRLGHRREVRP